MPFRTMDFENPQKMLRTCIQIDLHQHNVCFNAEQYRFMVYCFISCSQHGHSYS